MKAQSAFADYLGWLPVGKASRALPTVVISIISPATVIVAITIVPVVVMPVVPFIHRNHQPDSQCPASTQKYGGCKQYHRKNPASFVFHHFLNNRNRQAERSSAFEGMTVPFNDPHILQDTSEFFCFPCADVQSRSLTGFKCAHKQFALWNY